MPSVVQALWPVFSSQTLKKSSKEGPEKPKEYPYEYPEE
jgi:hypothetical protein